MADATQDLGPFKGGRPFKFTDPVELRRMIQNYFDWCDPHQEERLVESGVNQQSQTIFTKRMIMTSQKPYTTSGLARALGTTRRTLLDYEDLNHYTEEIPEDVRQELIHTIGDAKRRVEEFAEEFVRRIFDHLHFFEDDFLFAFEVFLLETRVRNEIGE